MLCTSFCFCIQSSHSRHHVGPYYPNFLFWLLWLYLFCLLLRWSCVLLWTLASLVWKNMDHMVRTMQWFLLNTRRSEWRIWTCRPHNPNVPKWSQMYLFLSKADTLPLPSSHLIAFCRSFCGPEVLGTRQKADLVASFNVLISPPHGKWGAVPFGRDLDLSEAAPDFWDLVRTTDYHRTSSWGTKKQGRSLAWVASGKIWQDMARYNLLL